MPVTAFDPRNSSSSEPHLPSTPSESSQYESVITESDTPGDTPGALTRALTADVLPLEVLVSIFSHLPPTDLDAVAFVCRRWREAASDSSWRASFIRQFSVASFNRVTASLTWRTELLTRVDYLHKWRKGRRTNLSFNACIWDISHVFCDFEASRIVCFSVPRGVGTIADPTKGKIASQRVFTDKQLHVTENTLCADGSRFGLIYGLRGGLVTAVLFSHETRLRDYVTLKVSHSGAVTAVWINKLESPRALAAAKTGTARIGALSASDDGHIFQWDMTSCARVADHAVCPGVPITHMTSDSRHAIVCVNVLGEVFYSRGPSPVSTPLNSPRLAPVDSHASATASFVKIGTFPTPIGSMSPPRRPDGIVPIQDTPYTFFEVDFALGYAVLAQGSCFMRFKLTSDIDSREVCRFVTPVASPHSHFVAANIDKTSFPVSSLSRDIPGYNGRYVVAGTSDNLIYIWPLHAKPIEDDSREPTSDLPREAPGIPPLRWSESPFQMGDSPLPSICAVALNATVLLVASYSGVTAAFDLLTGDFLRVVTSRFSRRALNMRQGPSPETMAMWPASYLEIDPDPANPHGVVVVRSAVQYFDLGADLEKSAIKKKGVKKKSRVPVAGRPDQSRDAIFEDIEMDLEMMHLEDGDDDLAEAREQRYSEMAPDYLSEEDQLQYALMLSQEPDTSRDYDEDEEIRRALEMSIADQTDSRRAPIAEPVPEPEPEYMPSTSVVYRSGEESEDNSEDEDVRRAMQLSMMDSPAESPGLPSSSALDDDMELAIQLSLNESGRPPRL